MVCFSGTVIRVALVRMLEYEKEYVCCRCKHAFTVKAEFEQGYAIPKPAKCPSADGCNSVKLACVSESGLSYFSSSATEAQLRGLCHTQSLHSCYPNVPRVCMHPNPLDGH